MIDERDPNNWGSGSLMQASVMDYTETFTKIPFPDQNVPISHHTLSTFSVVGTIGFSQLKISNQELSVADTNMLFEEQLVAEGGTPPYQWDLIQMYEMTPFEGEIPEPDQTQLIFDDTLTGQVMQKLDFSFPFYGETFDSVWVHTDGFLMFDEQPYPWPYMFDPNLMLRKTKNISPFLSYGMHIASGSDNGVWYEGDDTYAVFRWSLTGKSQNPPEINFALVLDPTGEIQFFYGDQDIFSNRPWAVGFSNGDEVSFTTVEIPDLKKSVFSPVRFTPVKYPEGLVLSDYGLLSCTPQVNHTGTPVQVRLTDHNCLEVLKNYYFKTNTAGIEDRPFSNLDLNTWPNPASDRIHVGFTTDRNMVVSLEIADLTGKSIWKGKPKNMPAGKNHLVVTTDQLNVANGIYYLIVRPDNGPASVSKIAIMNR